MHGHPRALVLLAREIAERGVRATNADLRTLMAELDRAHPGERENSLYASVALSLRRLPPDTRGHVHALACCHGGAHVAVIGLLTGLDVDAALRVGGELIGIGLGEDMGGGHLRLDPGLAPLPAGRAEPRRHRRPASPLGRRHDPTHTQPAGIHHHARLSTHPPKTPPPATPEQAGRGPSVVNRPLRPEP